MSSGWTYSCREAVAQAASSASGNTLFSILVVAPASHRQLTTPAAPRFLPGVLGDKVMVTREKTKIVVTATDAPFRCASGPGAQGVVAAAEHVAATALRSVLPCPPAPQPSVFLMACSRSRASPSTLPWSGSATPPLYHCSKRYLKYLTKKYLKKHNVRDWLRVIASNKDRSVYELR